MSDHKKSLDATHARVQKNFKYVTDKKQYGVIEKWVTPTDVDNVVGDCEDFALACRSILRESELPSRLVYCEDETGTGHAVLESGGWILDNRQRRVLTKQQMEKIGYKFITISGYEPGDDWHEL